MLDRLPLPSQLDRVIMAGGTIAGLVAAPIVAVLVVLLAIGRISGAELVFWLVASVILAGALGAVLAHNVVHAALSLVVALLGVAGIYLLLGSEFLALAQVLLYGGGVTILLLFGLMLTNAQDDPIVTDGSQRPFAFGVALLLGAVIAWAMVDGTWNGTGPAVIDLKTFGTRLFHDYGLPFLIAGVLLDVALAGAYIIARRDPATDD